MTPPRGGGGRASPRSRTALPVAVRERRPEGEGVRGTGASSAKDQEAQKRAVTTAPRNLKLNEADRAKACIYISMPLELEGEGSERRRGSRVEDWEEMNQEGFKREKDLKRWKKGAGKRRIEIYGDRAGEGTHLARCL